MGAVRVAQDKSSGRPQPRARLIALPGHDLPEEALAQPLLREGFTCHTTEISSPEAKAVDGSALLLWVGKDWDRGFSTISEWPESLRICVVLVGQQAGRRRGLIRRMVRVGGLAAVAFPMPAWFPGPLAEALTRLENPSRRRLSEELETLQAAQVDPASPEELLDLVAQAAKRLLGADLAVPAQKTLGGARALVRTADGIVVSQPWQEDVERRKAPSGLATLINERQEIRIIPKVRYRGNLKRGQGPGALEAAILLPILLPTTSLTDPAPTLFVSLNLYWSRPFFPTASEIAALEVLQAIARPAVNLLADQARRSKLHAVTNRVLSEALQFGLPKNDADSSAAWQDRMKRLAEVQATWPGIKALWIRRPQRGVEEESWFSSTPESLPLPRVQEPLPSDEGPVLIRHPEGWIVHAFAKDSEPRYGEVIALFENRAAAAQARHEVLGLATDLYITFRLHQRAEDTATLFQFAVPGRAEEAQEDILEMLRIVQRRLASDGAKAYVMARDADGVKIWQIANTDFTDAAKRPPRFLANRGLSDWVVQNRTWLLVPQLSKRPGEGAEKCWSGADKEKEVFVYTRSETEHRPDHPKPDREKTMLFVPLRSNRETIGALAVWRETPYPYDKGLDPGSLLYFSPHVATACRRMLQLRKGKEQLQAINHLTESLSQCKSIGEAWQVVADGVRTLASSRLAVLLRFDPSCGEYFLAACSDGAPDHFPSVAAKLSRFRSSVPQNAEPTTIVRAALETCLPDLSCRTFLIPAGGGLFPRLTVALFDTAQASHEPLLLPDEILDHFALSYLQTASGLLDRYPEALASHLIDDIGKLDETDEISADQVLDQAAAKLYQATGAEAVILYQGTEDVMTVRSSRPESLALADLEVRPQSMTKKALVDQRSYRVLDVRAHGTGLDSGNLTKMESAFGWASTGSWLASPIVHRERVVGLVKLLTSNKGPFLGPDQEEVTQTVADRTAAEMYKASSREHWRDLLQFIGEMSGLYGKIFEDTLVEKLTPWIRKALQRPHCELALISNIGPDSVPSLQLASEGGHRWLAALAELSRSTGRGSDLQDIQNPTRGVIAPLILPVEDRLAGHLFVLDGARFYADDRETIEKATQHIAFLIDNEIRREEWRQTMGRFRHALLGPVQGLTSAAKQLVREAQAAGISRDRLSQTRLQILKESELIRLWRDNHRFYLGSDFHIVRLRQTIRPVFERCLERYRPIAAQRDITLTLDLPPRDLVASIDAESLDIALSNLLDNACKYAFYNRSVNFGARITGGRTLHVWVEDIGRKIPEDVGSQIYRFGNRGAIRDPLRAITGQGIGLSLVMLIVAAHDGTLKHSSVRETEGRREEDSRTPYRVRFDIDFPWFV
jgi:signal transduction histidine kinase